ncbi:hypothetical protein AGMMS50239_14370 [Bacteroidia bacterium]|nr:hypothetical protein AGMMS50239_14370 [Bacteroidia bacterium]
METTVKAYFDGTAFVPVTPVTTIQKNTSDMIEDFVLLNEVFATRYDISWRDSFNYLKKHGGLDFYEKHYGYEHTQSYENTADTLARICKRNGGKLE